MTETELERLIVKLEGRGETYQRMITEALDGNKKLMESFGQVEKSQTRLIDSAKSMQRQWSETFRSMKAEFLSLSQTLAASPQFRADAISGGLNFAQSRMSPSAQNAVSMLRQYSGMTDQGIREEMGYVSHWFGTPGRGSPYLSALQPNALSESAREYAAGLRHKYGTVVRNDSRWNKVTRSIDYDMENMSPARAEKERYERERNATSQREQNLAYESKQERLAAHNRGRIDDPHARMAANQRAVSDADRELIKLIQKETEKRRKIDAMEGDSEARSQSKLRSKDPRMGGKDVYEESITEERAALDEIHEEYERVKAKKGRLAKDKEDFETTFIENLDDEKKGSSERFRRSGMSREERAKDTRVKGLGMSPYEADRLAGMDKQSKDHEKQVASTQDVKDKTEALKEQARMHGKVGLEAKITAAEIAKVPPAQIAAYREALIGEAAGDFGDESKDITEERAQIGLTHRQKRDRAAKKNIMDRGGTEYDAEKRLKEFAARDADIDKEERKKQGKDLTKSFDKQGQFDDLKKSLQKLVDETAITQKTMNMALSVGQKQIFGGGFVPQGPMQRGIDAPLAGSLESAYDLAEFRSKAFGVGGLGAAGGGASVAGKSTVKSRQLALHNKVKAAQKLAKDKAMTALGKRKKYGKSPSELARAKPEVEWKEPGVPSGPLNIGTHRERLLAAQNRAKEKASTDKTGYQARLAAAQGRAKSQQEASRTRIDANKKVAEKKGQDDEKKSAALLERIAKAVEDDARTKVTVAGIK